MSLPFVSEIENLLAQNANGILMMGETGPYLGQFEPAPAKLPVGREKILVTGGVGYIGSHAVKELQNRGHEILVLDNFSAGRTGLPANITGVQIVQGDLNDAKLLDEVFSGNNILAVVHFAGLIRVDESVHEPGKYFLNNVGGSVNLANAMLKHGVKRLVYSSSAAVYGNPAKIPVKESDACVPTNPYGETKLITEKIIQNYNKIHGFSAVALRYFNAAGAALDASTGEDHVVETHLIPKILDVAARRSDFLKIFGNDYPTRDGTAVRDYVHVQDLAIVHALALDKIMKESGVFAYNVGTGNGYSIMQVVQEVMEVTRRMIVCQSEPRREGDPAILVADASKLKAELGYELKYSDLNTIVKTAWEWHKKLPKEIKTN